ncbi:hypothetical protein BT69DRAFT_1283590 [Atractiella rhizophila]|nr:hypothetical protein BT69DRAFT_1283590 [Atractiella rhizophila]
MGLTEIDVNPDIEDNRKFEELERRFEELRFQFLRETSRPLLGLDQLQTNTSGHRQSFCLPPSQLLCPLIEEAFRSLFILPSILSLPHVASIADKDPEYLPQPTVLLLHALCLIGAFNMGWDKLRLLLSAHPCYSNTTYSRQEAIAHNFRGTEEDHHCLGGNCCSASLYRKYIYFSNDSDSPSEEEEVRQRIYIHHSIFIDQHFGRTLEEASYGLESVAKAGLLVALYWSQCQYNLGRIWRLKVLRVCTMLGWNKEDALKRYAPLEERQSKITFWFAYAWDAHIAIIHDESPFIPLDDITAQLPSSEIWDEDESVGAHDLSRLEDRFTALEPMQIFLECAILPIRVFGFWCQLKVSKIWEASKDLVADVENDPQFLRLADACERYQRSFPTFLLTELSSSCQSTNFSLADLSTRDFLYAAQCALSTATILLHAPIPSRSHYPAAHNGLTSSSEKSLQAAQTALSLLPLFKRTIEERRHWTNIFCPLFGMSGKVVFRALIVMKRALAFDEGEQERIKLRALEENFQLQVQQLKEITKNWRIIAPTIIPMLRLMETPEACLAEDFDLSRAGMFGHHG